MKNNTSGMTLIVKTITRLTVGLILIYAIYIVLHGHLGPGGSFAGGIIIALSFIHLMLAYGKDIVVKKLNETNGLVFASLGALVFLCFAAIGFTRGARVSESAGYFKLFGAGFIPLRNFVRDSGQRALHRGRIQDQGGFRHGREGSNCED